MASPPSTAAVSPRQPRDPRQRRAVARRVLLLLEDLGGGTGNHLCRLITHWHSHGWEVMVMTQTPPQVHQLPAGVEVRVMPNAGWYDRFPLAQVRRLLALRRLVKTYRPDVVHTYFFWSIVYGRILKLLGDVRVLVENREDLGFSWGRGSYRVLRATRAIPDRVICVADAVRDVAVAQEGVDRALTTVIRNGVEIASPARTGSAEARRQFGFGAEHIVIGMVANLPRTVKGGRHLLDAVAPIVAHVPNARFLLVGAGTEPEVLEPELRARGITAQVVGAGYRRDVESCYAAMDISVLTSSSEGLSITLLESMRYGLPTVVTRVGGNVEVVVEGVTGFLVPFGDAPAFVDRVVTLARDADRRRAMGLAGQRQVNEHFAIADVARRYLNVYDDRLAARDMGAPAVDEIPELEKIS
jgi:L-malate glycosyltransferase